MDDNEEPRPSTSKQDQEKRSHKTNSNTDVDKQDEQSSDTSISNTHSDNSHVDMGHERSKAPTGSKKERKAKGRKRGRPVATGRVVKRTRRPETKREVRRSKRVRDRKKKREMSISTIFTRLSSSMSMNQACTHCGHRCCRRRFDERRMRRNVKILSKKQRLHFKCMGTQTTGVSKCIQVGSRCLMLSPLCLNTNATQPKPIPEEPRSSGITPEMIYEALRRLSMWRQEVNTAAILNYIKRSYPVGFGEGLLAELTDKLRIAVIVGIVMQTSEDRWCLSTALQDRKITENHVTLFWKIYADTMKPVTKKPDQSKASPSQKTQDQQNNAVSCVKEIVPTLMYDYDVI